MGWCTGWGCPVTPRTWSGRRSPRPARAGRRRQVLGALGFVGSALGIGDALHRAYRRAWRLEARQAGLADRLSFLAWSAVVYCLLLGQVTLWAVLGRASGWVELALAPAWLVIAFVFWLWTPGFLARARLPWRSVRVAAALCAIGVVAADSVGARVLLASWVHWYGTLFGSVGVLIAMMAWQLLLAELFVAAAALSAVLAERDAQSSPRRRSRNRRSGSESASSSARA